MSFFDVASGILAGPKTDRAPTDTMPREQAIDAIEAAWRRAAQRTDDPSPEFLIAFAHASALIHISDQLERLADAFGAASLEEGRAATDSGRPSSETTTSWIRR